MEMEWEGQTLDPANVIGTRQPPPPFPSGAPNNQVSNHPPNDDIFGDLTSKLRNFRIVQYPEEKGFPQTAYNLANETGIKNINDVDVGKGAIPNETLFSYMRDGLEYAQLKANLHAHDSGSFIKCCSLDPVDIITINVDSCLSQIIDDRNKNAIDHEEDIDYDVPDKESDQSEVNVHKGFCLCLESNRFSSGNWGEGELLAIGSEYGFASIWCKNGELRKTLYKDEESISSILWNSKGDLLLIGSDDSRFIIWDTITWKPKQKLRFDPELPVVIAAWRDNTSFTICSRDMRIYVWNVGDSQPIIIFTGHQGDIDGIKWDPTGTLLASYSEDGAIKIWTLKQNQSLHNLMHCERINSIRWSWTGPGTSNPNKQLLLASAADDGTVKIWDGVQGHLLYSFNGHRRCVIEMEFSPDGDYIASESDDGRLLIWKVKDGTIVKSCDGCDPWCYNLSWNREGNKIAAGCKNYKLNVIRLW
ncbi:WD40 repeat-containing protein HOS15-like isoform X4 [Dioscorea cayenensis subsp. rotundata]|uniref:WD40 repeat-containing protein HOS15-like isoform X4 n=1 Tax=Dioscorea cayennensis subsp. rotundata TaxID=55577 RepID=A0AB40CXY9_DIOCR|nr:WD40 repeat-containing protein HOS15-like isoform X4 [Dioscorea cayenensis subsp. rotundata]